MRRALLAIAVLSAMSGAALAQDAAAPVMGSSAETDQPAADNAEQPAQILVLGDAVGGGLGAGLMRMADIDGRYEVSIRFNEESGLARPDVYDWAETLPKILETNDFDIIVVQIGTNDRQMIRSGNERFAFDSAAWTDIYTKRIDQLLNELAGSKAKIFWVSLPPMAAADYDADMQLVADLQRQRVEAHGFTYVDIRKAFTSADGQYTDTGPDDTGEVRKLRGRDGVSFFKAGNNRMGQLVLAAIESDSAAAVKTSKETAAKPEPPAGPKPAAGPKPPAVPLFGQVSLLGETVTLVPEDVVMNATVVAGETVNSAAALAALKAMSPPGSDAERLFRTGDSMTAPPGRADDFAAPSKTE